jgi:NADH-quinone oxidoreductase subunit M
VDRHILSIVLFTPLVGALVLWGSGLAGARNRHPFVHIVGSLTTALTMLVSVPLWLRFQVRGEQWQFTDQLSLLPSLGLHYAVGVDGLALVLVLLTTVLSAAAALASWTVTSTAEEPAPGHPARGQAVIRESSGFGMGASPGQAVNSKARGPAVSFPGVTAHYVALLVLEAAMLGVYMSLDLVGFVIWWFVAALAMCYLCGSVATSLERSRLGRRFVDIAVIPSLVLMAAVVTLHLQGRKLIGIATFDLRNFQAVTPSVDIQHWLFAMFLVAFVATLAGVFRWWLSVAASRSVLSVSVVLAAVFLKMGTYGFVRLTLPLLPDATRTFAPLLVAVAALGILFGAVAALAQPNWTRVLAYATFSHICLVLLGTFALTPDGLTGSIVHQISHGVSIAALLFLAGVVAARGKGTSLAEYGGLLTTMPVVAALWLLSTLSLVAVPKLSGFVGTRLIIEGSWSVHPVWSVVAIAGLGVSAIALLWLFARTMLGELRSPSGHDLKDLRLQEAIVIVPLAVFVIWVGYRPAAMLATIETSVARVVLRVSPQFAPEVSGCLSAPPPPEQTGLPAGMVMASPCVEGTTTSPQPDKK